ncbi:MAG: hypothetical protein F6K56_36030 [Moorea sp. SIO3G5]|nr:hypothetical protein [Moorena sp. SIO3G5]
MRNHYKGIQPYNPCSIDFLSVAFQTLFRYTGLTMILMYLPLVPMSSLPVTNIGQVKDASLFDPCISPWIC